MDYAGIHTIGLKCQVIWIANPHSGPANYARNFTYMLCCTAQIFANYALINAQYSTIKLDILFLSVQGFAMKFSVFHPM